MCQPPDGPWELSPLMFGILLMQATQLLRKMMEWMRLVLVHCAPGAHHLTLW